MSIVVDMSRHPLIVCTFEGAASDMEFTAYLAQLSTNLARRTKTAITLDMTRANPASPAQRQQQSDWLRQHDDLLARYSVGIAFCFASPVFRFVLSGLLLMQRLPAPYHVCATRKEGIAWAEEQLRRAGVIAPG